MVSEDGSRVRVHKKALGGRLLYYSDALTWLFADDAVSRRYEKGCAEV